MPHPAIAKDNVAVITGGASGIGLAAAVRFAALGHEGVHRRYRRRRAEGPPRRGLSSASPDGGANVMAAKVDVSSRDELIALRTRRADNGSAAPTS